MYSAVYIYDSKNNDCLAVDNQRRDSIIRFFEKGITELNENKDFTTQYWKMIDEYKEKMKITGY